jgi:hypothetical protein
VLNPDGSWSTRSWSFVEEDEVDSMPEPEKAE